MLLTATFFLFVFSCKWLIISNTTKCHKSYAIKKHNFYVLWAQKAICLFAAETRMVLSRPSYAMG